jgi:alkylhydroperoxidase/carboxymuconolactone decarboxylase family protein YurZ
MTGKDRPNVDCDTVNAKLPAAARHMALEYPDLWGAFERLGEAASRAGPLEPRTRRLIHLALAIAADSEGATHSHVRRATAEGISSEELEHVAVLAITTTGWSQAMKGLAWVRDITRAQSSAAVTESIGP